MTRRARVTIRGAVQGVGFRPFVYRLASEMGVRGWVRNSAHGVFIEAEAEPAVLERFVLRLDRERPPRAFIHTFEQTLLDAAGFERFEILGSLGDDEPTTLVLPDLATCPDCLGEIGDPADRRYRYPFTNCTNCGPRFSIIEALPYDRVRTSMRRFEMCAACRREYEDPRNRRFHAEPIACPACGPALALWAADGTVRARDDDALRAAAADLGHGQIVAVKGLGGFHLMADARSEAVVMRLRERKHREEKPLALMFPALADIEAVCQVTPAEARLLQSAEAPIVLLRRRPDAGTRVARAVAPGNPYLGVMLPYTPLHHLLLREVAGPVVATSGNLSDEPICTDEREALKRLAGIADTFLAHDRPIVRHVDDSVVRVMLGRELVLRRARGYAPLPVPVEDDGDPLLGVGAHLKNTIALAVGRNAFLSQHVGDLETAEALAAFTRIIDAFGTLYRTTPAAVAADLHPDYPSTRYARESGLPLVVVQHHHAHVASCKADNGLRGTVLGVPWDGTGYGADGTIWGGEFLLTGDDGYSRVATLRPFRLPGGDRAIKEPRRAALGLLYEWLGPSAGTRVDLAPVRAFHDEERRVLLRMLVSSIHAPWTSSAGRLFDAAASLLGLRQHASFEGQAAMELEFAVDDAEDGSYPTAIAQRTGGGPDRPPQDDVLIVDWQPLVASMLEDVSRGVAVRTIAARFHHGLADAIVAVARRVGEPRVVLTGGCFQNRVLTETTVRRLEAAGFRPYWHQRVPPNDGGIALGQVAVARRARSAPSIGGS